MRAEHLLNRTIAGYRLLEILGKGGMGIVFLAQRLDNPREQAAIKILLRSELSTTGEFATFQARFLREIYVVRQLSHEHILPILDSGEEEDSIFYMVMPLMSGGTLAQKITSRSGLLPLNEIAHYLDQLASAIDYSNQQGMVHRDIKPGNVLLDEQGNVYLADFGIARLFDSGLLALDEAPTTLTATGKIYGTPAYMAPERFNGEPAGPAMDIYALGILLYQLVTGKLPFSADNPLALAMKHLNEEPVSPRSLRPDLPEPAEVAIYKAIAKRPAERFSTASSLATAFSTGLKGEWVEELRPLAAILAISSLETQGKQPAIAPVAPVAENARHNQFLFSPTPETARNDHPLAPVTKAPAAVRPAPSFWKNFRPLILGMLGAVLLLSAGLLALVVHQSETPTSQPPGIHSLPTGTSGLPTKTAVTPVSSVEPRPTSGSTPTSLPTPGNTPAPTPTTGTGSTPVLTPTPGATPAPTAEGTP